MNELLATVKEYIVALSYILEEQNYNKSLIKAKQKFNQATTNLYQSCVTQGGDFPTESLEAQLELLLKPINSWDNVEINKEEFSQASLVEKEEGSYILSDFAKDIADNYNAEFGFIKNLMKAINYTGIDNQLYTLIRTTFIKNPIIKKGGSTYREIVDKLDEFERKLSKADKEIIEDVFNLDSFISLEKHLFMNHYYKITKDIFYQCPYCGYELRTVENTDGSLEHSCFRKDCLTRNNNQIKRIETNDNYYIIKQELARYVTQPGKLEIEIYQRLKKLNLKLELYPELDTADLLIEFKGKKYLIDIKDWRSPHALVNHLNEKQPFLKDAEKDFGALVLADSVGEAYINYVKNNWIESRKYEVLKASELYEIF